ncbi:hypothetical protein KVR01_002818 [Diaporthe batatas]|uniref:uncharacterized protein n=1 Tax=Diaporthe batatas TaxID=748121 RepID=UPI001D05B287|nr:uncharacterized protein KVR01_002818 [Diaporthe batatas]KAG8167129.1 hypothetical protein KVR01_002818 [Diaporthe batatas]
MSVPFGTLWTQWFPPSGPLSESNLPSQKGKVFIVTGGSSGLGYVLSRILYGAGAKVYILTRSKERADEAIAKIKSCYDGRDDCSQLGSLEFIQMDLMDLESVKGAALEFLDREGPDGRLDVLFNNAGTGARKNAPKSAQGHEYHMTTNTLGSFVLTQHLLPILSRTASSSPAGTVRVIWAASILVEMNAPPSGVSKEWMQDQTAMTDYIELYSQTKAGVWFLASEFARRQSQSGVLFIAGNPGTYNTGMWQYTPALVYWLFRFLMRDESQHGADTYLWMGFSDSVTIDDAVAGRYAICDGRWHPGQRSDLLLALRSEAEGGSGRAGEFFEWCENATKAFLP